MLAFVLGALVQRFRVSPLVGYLLAGVVMGPFTPGFARSHSQDETAHLMEYGATRGVMGEEEIAKAMIADARATDAVAGEGAYASETSLTPLPERTPPSAA